MLHDLQFERYELYVSEKLSSVRKLVGTFKSLATAQRIGNIDQNFDTTATVAIDYIGLYGNGRDEQFWVKSHEDGRWIKL